MRITGIRFDFVSTVFKPLLAAGCCGAAAYGMWRCLARATGGARLDALFAVAAGAAVYAAALVLLRAVRPQELKRLLRMAR